MSKTVKPASAYPCMITAYSQSGELISDLCVKAEDWLMPGESIEAGKERLFCNVFEPLRLCHKLKCPVPLDINGQRFMYSSAEAGSVAFIIVDYTVCDDYEPPVPPTEEDPKGEEEPVDPEAGGEGAEEGAT